MAKTTSTLGTKAKTTVKKSSWTHPWSKRQFLTVGAGLGVIIIGYLLLATGLGSNWDNPLAISVAPVVLVIGYCVVIPVGIMLYKKPDDQ